MEICIVITYLIFSASDTVHKEFQLFLVEYTYSNHTFGCFWSRDKIMFLIILTKLVILFSRSYPSFPHDYIFCSTDLVSKIR